MDLTKLSALQEPEVWNDYLYERSSETNKFISSGIMTNDSVLGPRLLQAGRRVELPYLNDLTGDADEWNDETDIKTTSSLVAFAKPLSCMKLKHTEQLTSVN